RCRCRDWLVVVADRDALELAVPDRDRVEIGGRDRAPRIGLHDRVAVAADRRADRRLAGLVVAGHGDHGVLAGRALALGRVAAVTAHLDAPAPAGGVAAAGHDLVDGDPAAARAIRRGRGELQRA